METAYIALGSNLGDRAANLRLALDELAATPGLILRRCSSFLENPAVGGPSGQPPFLNAAAELGAELSPQSLMARLLEIETQLGRVRTVHWGPRIIDLDLLLYNSLVLHEPGLEIPHPRLAERSFVLQPLAEIAPDVVHPILGLRVRDLLARLR